MIQHRIADWTPGQTGIEVRGMEAVMLHIYSAHAKRQANDQLAAQAYAGSARASMMTSTELLKSTERKARQGLG